MYAQHTIVGAVQDSLGNPIKSVNVRLVTDMDTMSASTNKKGEYKFSNINGNYALLNYSMIGFKTESSSYFFVENQKLLFVPIVTLKSFSQLITGVTVSRVQPMVNLSDTIQFNFAAFDFYQNSLLEEALKKIPGFQVYRDGSVTYNGRIIRKVRVDNKEFFGGDLLTATRNIPADIIKNIQLLNAKTISDDNSGILREDEEKVLNINLKDDNKKIYFGQLTAGKGTNSRYVGSFGVNKFDSGREISVLGSFNNTNTNLFAFGNPTGGDRLKSTLDLESYADPIDGLNELGSLGVNFADQLSKEIYFNASYNYLYNSNLTRGNSQLSSTYVGNTIFRRDDYVISTNDRNHKLRLGFDVKFKNKDVLKVNSNFSFQQQINQQEKDLMINNLMNQSEGNYQDSSRKSSPIGDLELMYSKFFNQKGRKFLINLNFNSNNDLKSESVRERYFEYNLKNSYNNNNIFDQHQLISQRNNSNALKTILTYVEPFSTHSLLEISYEFESNETRALRTVKDPLMDLEDQEIDSLSLKYIYTFNSHKWGMLYQYEPFQKLKLNVGFAVQPLFMRGNLPLESTKYNYDNVNLIPTANIIYKFSKESDWQLNYRGRNNQPYFIQIAPVIDNSNSRNIVIGNPELKADYTHRISTTYRRSNAYRMQFFETNLAYNFVINKIVSDKKTLPSSTIQETTFKNAKGYYDWRWYYTFNTPIFSEDLQLDLTGTADYYNNLSFIDGRERTTKQVLLNQSLQLKYSWNDYFESNLKGNYMLNQARYDIPYKAKIDIKTMFLGLGLKGYLSDNFALGMEMSQRFNDGYKNNLLNVNQTLMNTFLEYTFLQNKSAMLRLQANDLFDQNKNSGIISEYIGNDVYEAKNNRLGRYFMLSLNIRLQKLPKNN